MNKKLHFIFLFILLIPTLVSARTPYWAEYLHIPDDYATMPNLLYFVLIPFLGTFAISWGLLTSINIFHNYRVNVLLALVFATSLMYYGVLLAITHYLFAIGGIVGVILFFVMFFVMSSLYGYKKTTESYIDSTKAFREEKEKIKQRKKTLESLKRLNDELIDKRKKQHECQQNITYWENIKFNHASGTPRHGEACRKLSVLEGKRQALRQEIKDIQDRMDNLDKKIINLSK